MLCLLVVTLQANWEKQVIELIFILVKTTFLPLVLLIMLIDNFHCFDLVTRQRRPQLSFAGQRIWIM